MEIDEIKRHLKNGKSPTELAKVTEYTVAQLAIIKRKLKLPRRSKVVIDKKEQRKFDKALKMYQEGEMIKTIVEKTGITRNRIHRFLNDLNVERRQKRKSITGQENQNPELIKRIHQLAIFDYTPSEIAEDVNLPVYNVRNVISSLGLRENK